VLPAAAVVVMVRIRSNEDKEIPLHLIPKAIARKIRKVGDTLYRVSIKRTHWHHYNISVRTRPIRMELVPLEVALSALDMPESTGKRLRKSRRCTV